MMRILHRWPGLILAVLLFVTAASGAALSVFPALEAARSPQAADTMTVAELAQRVQASHPGLEQIKRSPSGEISDWGLDGSQPDSAWSLPTWVRGSSLPGAGATIAGVGALIEKNFEGGRALLRDLHVPTVSLAVIASLDNGITFA